MCVVIIIDKDDAIQTLLTVMYGNVCQADKKIFLTDLYWIEENFEIINKVCYHCVTFHPHPLSIFHWC